MAAASSVALWDERSPARLAVDHRLGRPSAVPGHRGSPAAAASRNTMPNPSCSSPRQRLRQDMANTSAPRTGRAGLDWRRGPGAAPGLRLGMPSSSRARSRPPPAIATTGRDAAGASLAAASISVSIPLRGTSRLTLSTSGPSPAGRGGPGSRLARGRPRAKPRVHPRRDADDRRKSSVRRAGPPPRGYPPAAMSSEAPHTRASTCRVAGSRPGHGHLGAVQDRRRTADRGSDRSARGEGRVDDHGLGPDLGRQTPDAAGEDRGRQQDRLTIRSTRNG